MSGNGTIKIVITDDHQLFRESLYMVLQNLPGMQVVGEAENGREALEKVMELNPDVITMDIRMPVLDGIQATLQIKKIHPHAIVIALSNNSEDHYRNEMISAGASDYLLKSDNTTKLEESIRYAFSRKEDYTVC